MSLTTVLPYTVGSPQRLSPELNNVCFASAEHRWSFTLLSFAEMYSTRQVAQGGQVTAVCCPLYYISCILFSFL